MDKAYELAPNTLGDVPLSLITPDPEQPRTDFDEEYIEQLAASIKKDGVIQPIVLRNNPEQPGQFIIVAGENRFRASKLAKKKTIPAVLREVDGLDKLIIQLKENHQRKDLNPMEMAKVLHTMNKQFGLKQADVEKTLKESGVGNFGRPYISNMIRLLELPEWAQSLIRNNAITASHGKFLLQAMASPKVMEAMRAKFEEDNWQPTTAELQSSIYYSFNRHHTDLTGWETEFDYRVECVSAGCQKMRKITHHTETTFCLDKECHAMKQAEEEKKQEAQHKAQREHEQEHGGGESSPREISFDDQNRVDVNQQELNFHRDFIAIENADFDTGVCEGCPRRHIALLGADSDNQREIDACFLITCFHEKDSAANRAASLTRKYIDKAIADKIRGDVNLAIRLMSWKAAGEPEVSTSDDGEEIDFSHWHSLGDLEDLEKLLFKNGTPSLKAFIKASEEQLAEIAAFLVRALDGDNLVDLMQALSISVDDYRIDDDYLSEHTEEELLRLCNSAIHGSDNLKALEKAKSEGKLDKFLKKHAAEIGVPAEIRYAYQQLISE